MCVFIYLFIFSTQKNDADKLRKPGNLWNCCIIESLNDYAGDTFPASFCGSLFYCTSAKAWHAKQSSWKAGLGVRSTPQTII